MKKLAVALALFLGACVSSNLTPQQAVFQAESDYAAVLKLANGYASLPTCSDTQKAPCKTLAILDTVKKADLAAQATLTAAEATVRDPAFSGSVSDQVVVSAQNALSAFQNVVNIATGTNK